MTDTDEFIMFCKGKGFSYNGGATFTMSREYAIPECVGCIMTVDYRIECDESLVTFRSVMHRRPCSELGNLSACFKSHYFANLYYDFMPYSSSRKKGRFWGMKTYVSEMVAASEAKLKNLFGMKRIA